MRDYSVPVSAGLPASGGEPASAAVPASGRGTAQTLGGMMTARLGAWHVWPAAHSVSEAQSCICVAVQLD